MISWKCDGCGKTEETRYFRSDYVSPSYLGFNAERAYDVPMAPEDWWVGKRRRMEGSSYRITHHFALACSGKCCDEAQRKLGKVDWEWRAPSSKEGER